MGVWLSGHVPILPVQASNGEGRHDARHGDSQQERYGEEGARGTAREDERGEAEGERSRTGRAICCARRSEGGKRGRKRRQVMVEAVVSVDRQTRPWLLYNLCYTVRYIVCINDPADR
jgi:hypothetical protein